MHEGTMAKADFLSNISHELRTPLTVAKGISHVLKSADVPPEEGSRFLEQLADSIDKLASMVDEIIEISELERGTFDLDIQYVDLSPLIAYAVADIGERYPNVPILTRVPEFLGALADGERVAGAIRELSRTRVGTAGGPDRRRPREVMDEGIAISVLDHGRGLDDAPSAFEQPFSTGEAIRAGEGRRRRRAAPSVRSSSATAVSRDGPVPAGGTRFVLPPVAAGAPRATGRLKAASTAAPGLSCPRGNRRASHPGSRSRSWARLHRRPTGDDPIAIDRIVVQQSPSPYSRSPPAPSEP
jgi:hypothetical protein